ncbi:MAG: hypothetical protein A2144_05940 [Chloroflexi bacterium RBG_16_50_9]|nr:MAG: hypothetical protein A2144_05940 [Chloroflexi bacterium RBG_16_50_9]
MFRRSKDKRKDSITANAGLAKKIIGKDSGRRTFGFPCSPDIPAQLKMLAGKLNVPIYALAEHSLQLSAALIAKMAEAPEECELLRRHIMDDHVGRRTIEKISQYDEEMADLLDEERHRRFQIEKAVRQIVVDFVRSGLKTQEIPWLIDYGMRCRIAVACGRPVPTDSPKEGRYYNNPQPSKG